MQKLLDQYRVARTLKLAQRIRAYERKHSMSVVCLSKENQDLLADAIYQANLGADYYGPPITNPVL